ncbi:hypothetical protein [Nocardia sp. NPDC019395]|uniref:hypothetical protein n=1 Tax=Nocardia sp. NPDC019395 TaxID=3154686 RepID=UPI0033DAE606
MADKLEFNSSRAAEVAGKVDEIGDRIRSVLSRMSAAESAGSGCWGGDETGQKFANGENGNGYLAGSKNCHKVLDSAWEFLSGEKGYAPEFRDATKALHAMEQHNRARFGGGRK